MALPLNKERLALAYDYFCDCPPFDLWNMPPSEEVLFHLIRSNIVRGLYYTYKGKHNIAISAKTVGWTSTLFETMAHEMIHLHQADVGMETPHAEHNRAFIKLAAKVCEIHGYEPHRF